MRILFAALVLMVAPAAHAQQSTLTIKHTYAFATAESQKNGAVFGVIQNKGEEDVRIVSANADVSETVELHTHIMDGDVMQMREVDGYNIPAGEELVLEPAGDHIMLMNLKAPLDKDQSFIAAVITEDGEEINFPVMIMAPGVKASEKEEHNHEHDGELVHCHEHDHFHDEHGNHIDADGNIIETVEEQAHHNSDEDGHDHEH